jgi:ATPase subunit of ABC transporter with duplicated ATPase domains
VLSGGEKARLVMAKILFNPPNLLILDEPMNHLDMATKEILVAALAELEGTMLFVSHNRHFLAALSNRVLELTPDGVHQYGGGLHGICDPDRPGGAGSSPGRVDGLAKPTLLAPAAHRTSRNIPR